MAGMEGPAPKDEMPGGDIEENARVTFVEGDLVVYPNHGAGCVAGIEEKTILGEVRRYLSSPGCA